MISTQFRQDRHQWAVKGKLEGAQKQAQATLRESKNSSPTGSMVNGMSSKETFDIPKISRGWLEKNVIIGRSDYYGFNPK